LSAAVAAPRIPAAANTANSANATGCDCRSGLKCDNRTCRDNGRRCGKRGDRRERDGDRCNDVECRGSKCWRIERGLEGDD
jgi:hypothetical protein